MAAIPAETGFIGGQMSTQTLIWRLILLYIGLLAGLIGLTVAGYAFALIGLTVLVTVSLIGIGLGFGLGYLRQSGKQQQDAFTNNARENLAIMNAMQTLQNKQNQALLKQVKQLPEGGMPQPINLVFEEGVFDELE